MSFILLLFVTPARNLQNPVLPRPAAPKAGEGFGGLHKARAPAEKQLLFHGTDAKIFSTQG